LDNYLYFISFLEPILQTFITLYFSSWRGLSSDCWKGLALNFIEALCVGISFFLPLYFMHDLQMDVINASLMISIYGAGTVLGSYIGGKTADHFSPYLIAITSFSLQGIALANLLLFTTPLALRLDMFVFGACSYIFLTANQVWVLQLCRDDQMRMKAINVQAVIANLANGTSSLFISFFASISLSYIIGVSAYLVLGTALIIIGLPKKLKLNSGPNPINRSDHVEKVSVVAQLFILCLICLFLVGLIIFQLGATYPIFIKQIFPQWQARGVGGLFAINCFLVVTCQAQLLDLLKKLPKLLLLGSGGFLLGLGFFLLAFTSHFSLAILSCIIFTLGEMLFFSVAQFIAYHAGPFAKKGARLGLYRMVYALSRIIAPVSGGYIYQHYSASMLWIGLGCIGLATALLCLCYGAYSLFLTAKVAQGNV